MRDFSNLDTFGASPEGLPGPAAACEKLGEREAAILAGLLEAYLASGVPVGSKALAETRADSPCSATIRHILAALEQSGYLSQPHTSAGRIPTPKAIRWWLQRLAAPTPLHSHDGQRLERVLLEASDETTLWLRASEFLAEVTGQVGVVALQPWRDAGLRHLRFFRLTDRRVLAILVAADGQVRERVGRLPEAFTQAELDAAARYLNLNFAGCTLPRIRRELRHRLEEERADYDALLRRVLVLSHCGVLEMQDAGAVYVQGAGHLAGLREGQKLAELLARLEQKERWLRLLTEMDAGADDTVAWPADGVANGVLPQIRVRVGLDQEELPELALVAASFHSGAIHAAVGILGSTRMEYQTALSAVTLVQELFNRVLGESLHE